MPRISFLLRIPPFSPQYLTRSRRVPQTLTIQQLRPSVGADPQSAAVPDDGFDPGARAIREQEQMPAQRIVSELIAHQSVQTFKALAHIHRFHRHTISSPVGGQTSGAFGHADQASQFGIGELRKSFDAQPADKDDREPRRRFRFGG